MTLHHGDCLDVMAGMDPESVDAIVTDPPYGLEFMGKEWDRLDGGAAASQRLSPAQVQATSPAFKMRGKAIGYTGAQTAFHARWAEAAYRVAKPSAYLLAFGGTRTVHRMTVALEDAGWVIRDMLVWAYASGFPKSKASLKPAWEPIVMARKPGPLRELAIDACRIGTTKDVPVSPRRAPQNAAYGDLSQSRGDEPGFDPNIGRWPANVILTDPIFDGGVEGVVGGGEANRWFNGRRAQDSDAPLFGDMPLHKDAGAPTGYDDSGTYSRFFLIPKADRADREPVLTPDGHDRATRFTTHPTVKPTDLMRHLVRLVTPPGGTVLDPFLGSGTTAIAAEMEGFPWIGIEREAEYIAIAEARLNGVQRGLGLAI